MPKKKETDGPLGSLRIKKNVEVNGIILFKKGDEVPILQVVNGKFRTWWFVQHPTPRFTTGERLPIFNHEAQEVLP